MHERRKMVNILYIDWSITDEGAMRLKDRKAAGICGIMPEMLKASTKTSSGGVVDKAF